METIDIEATEETIETQLEPIVFNPRAVVRVEPKDKLPPRAKSIETSKPVSTAEMPV